ncbi:anti-sigma factor family protein [Ponticoccus litoralis]|uniref:Zf-HC2 domain-containing protein n=1 Tax=Ponticoccus litoralis TaxID=422297 RepID=A0AAW9SWG5_9RHOB
MAEPKLTDEILMAYADGELDASTARAVEAAIETDPEVAERVALFGDTARVLKQAAQARPEPPCPTR